MCEGDQEGAPPFFALAVRMMFVYESVDAVKFAEVAFVYLPVMFICDLLIRLEERMEPIFCGVIKKDRWIWNEVRHLSGSD